MTTVRKLSALSPSLQSQTAQLDARGAEAPPCAALQAALATVQSYPWTCDVPSIVNVVAASCAEPNATELLLQAQQ